MREILFRGKRVDTGEWVYGNYAHTDCYIKHNDYIGQNSPLEYMIAPETVGQYTGLFDKNGKRIFEGDIVIIPNSKKQGLPAVIRWSQSETRFEISRMGYQALSLDPLFSRIGYYSRCEVIGNIHDNPELMEVSKK